MLLVAVTIVDNTESIFVDDFVEIVDAIVDRMFVVLVEELKVDILVLVAVDN